MRELRSKSLAGASRDIAAYIDESLKMFVGVITPLLIVVIYGIALWLL